VIDEKYIELIQADVDGELPDVRRAELAAYLLANPEARALRDELKQLCTVLDEIPQEDPPPGLRDSILAASRIPEAVPARRGRHTPASAWSMGFRYAAVFAGGLLAGAIAIEAGLDRQAGLDPSDAAGTMIAGDPATRSTPVDSAQVALEQIHGSVQLFRSAAIRVLQFDLSASQPIEVAVAYDGREARFSGMGSTGKAGVERYALALDGPGVPGEPITITFLAGGQPIHRDELRVPPPGN
jgi:hypothetical protein